MAVARLPITSALATVLVPGTSVAPSSPVPDNCTGLALVNTGLNPALFGIGVPGVPLTEGLNASRLAVGASLSLPLGDLFARGIMDEDQLAGSGLVFDALVGATAVGITYLNSIGAPE